MYSDSGAQVDFESLNELLARADVLVVGFVGLVERLLIDVRANETEGPMVTQVGPVATVQERYIWLGQNRGAFGAPQAFSFFVWPAGVASLIQRQALAPLRDRLAAVSTDAGWEFDRELRAFLPLERAAVREAILGEGQWRALWQRPGTRRA